MNLIKPNNFFNEIFVLSIPRRTNRWLELRERLIREDIYVKYFEGIDKEHPNVKRTYNTFLRLHPKYEWTDGNHAVMLSFINLFKHLLYETNYQQILICEDDILFHNDFANLFNKSAEKIPDDWKIWYLGYVRWDLTELKYINSDNLFVYPNNMTGNFAVAYKRDSFESVLKAIEQSYFEGILTTDQTIRKYFHNKYTKTYVSEPMLMGHDYGYSDTAGRSFSERYWGRTEKIGRYINKTIYH